MRKLSIKIEVSDAATVMFEVFDVDTSAGGDPQTLPDFADVPDGYVVMVDDVGGNCGTTPAEISGDATIDGEANYELRVDDGKVFFRKDAGAGEWKRVGTAPGAEDVLLEYAVNTSGGPVSITLPSVASVQSGFIVRVYDTTGNAGTNNITVDRFDAPDSIDGEVSYTISTNYGAVWLVGNGIASWAVSGVYPVIEESGEPLFTQVAVARYVSRDLTPEYNAEIDLLEIEGT